LIDHGKEFFITFKKLLNEMKEAVYSYYERNSSQKTFKMISLKRFLCGIIDSQINLWLTEE